MEERDPPRGQVLPSSLRLPAPFVLASTLLRLRAGLGDEGRGGAASQSLGGVMLRGTPLVPKWGLEKQPLPWRRRDSSPRAR